MLKMCSFGSVLILFTIYQKLQNKLLYYSQLIETTNKIICKIDILMKYSTYSIFYNSQTSLCIFSMCVFYRVN